MDANTRISGSFVAKLVLAVVTFGAATGVAFAAWMENGTGIYRTMVETGLSWCM